MTSVPAWKQILARKIHRTFRKRSRPHCCEDPHPQTSQAGQTMWSRPPGRSEGLRGPEQGRRPGEGQPGSGGEVGELYLQTWPISVSEAFWGKGLGPRPCCSRTPVVILRGGFWPGGGKISPCCPSMGPASPMCVLCLLTNQPGSIYCVLGTVPDHRSGAQTGRNEIPLFHCEAIPGGRLITLPKVTPAGKAGVPVEQLNLESLAAPWAGL
ncbi:PREDICTED: uncharacterized protein LOC106149141 isoform X1 [Chinchilla lanigera]|uniref:uncharacterized protein LOC106149141 isoform X1 n=1 Tax=Chinchilla lanigera TaxID=34839 RepID=UPI000696337E|nr:PREDICTED: uncharacterized protein LOC106149141 isoform X1 [Chinchilla lanigera]